MVTLSTSQNMDGIMAAFIEIPQLSRIWLFKELQSKHFYTWSILWLRKGTSQRYWSYFTSLYGFRMKNLQDGRYRQCFLLDKSCRKMYTIFSPVLRQQRKSDVMTHGPHTFPAKLLGFTLVLLALQLFSVTVIHSNCFVVGTNTYLIILLVPRWIMELILRKSGLPSARSLARLKALRYYAWFRGVADTDL
jgi:hypothetical protein